MTTTDAGWPADRRTCGSTSRAYTSRAYTSRAYTSFLNNCMSVLKRNTRRVRWELRLRLDRVADWFYSIDTVVAGPLPQAKESSRFGDAYVNGPVSYWILRSYLDCKNFGPKEVFYDIGCGHGRVLCMVARHRVAKCIGIELSTEFAEKARANAAALRGRLSPIEVRVGDAVDMDYTDGTTFYFGDPFGADTMRAVLKRIGQSVAATPRAVRCIFVLPVAERSDAVRRVIEISGWLRFVGEQSLSYSPMRVEYWAWVPNQN
jgi:SAM-dependent methyltransferase